MADRDKAGRRKPWAGRSSRQERGYGAAWVRLRARILRRDRYLCQPCLSAGHVTKAEHVDHITAKSKGGTDDSDNLQAICAECHREKTSREAAEAQGRTHRPKRAIGADGWPRD